MKPSVKFIIVQNTVLNIPLALALSITASLMNNGITLQTWILSLLGFVISCIISAVLPIQKINKSFPKLFHVDPDKISGRLIANIPVSLIFTAIILMVMVVITVGPHVGYAIAPLLEAFLGMLLPLFVVAFVVAMIFAPISLKAAMLVDKKHFT